MAAPTFRSVGTVTSFDGSGSGYNLTIAGPSCQVGDLLIAFIAFGVSSINVTPPDNTWKASISYTASGPVAGVVTYYKRATSADTTGLTYPFTIASSGSYQISAVIAAYIGGSIAQTASGGQSAGTITTNQASLIVEAWSVWYPDSSFSISAPPTARASADGSSTTEGFALSDQTQTSAGQSAQATVTVAGSGTIRQIASVTLALATNQAPNAPGSLQPAGNPTLNRPDSNRLSWTFSDPDASDSQSQFDIYIATQGSAFPNTPTASVVTPNQFYDIAANSLAVGSYQWKVVTYDSQGALSPASSASFFTMANPANGPTITHPISGGTVAQSDEIDWSAPTQYSYQVQNVGDNSGTIDTSTVYSDTGEVVSSSVRSAALTFPVNGRYQWLRVRIKTTNGGNWTAWSQVRVQVQFTPPPKATVTATAYTPNGGAMTYTITTPAPTGSQPTATSASIYASPDGGKTIEWQRSNLPINVAVVFQTPTSDVNYAVRIVTYASGGQSNDTGWLNP